MINYQAHLATAQEMERNVAAEIERLTRVRWSLLGQIDLLQQFIALEEPNHAIPGNPGQPGALPAGVVQPGTSAPDSGAGQPDRVADCDPDPNPTA